LHEISDSILNPRCLHQGPGAPLVNKFADSRAALEFLVSRIVAEARRENVQLSDVERDMLYFSETHWTLPNIAEVNEQFDAEYDQDEYEEKIARLIRNARDHARKENPVEFEGWSNALKALNREDRYLLVMVARAGAGPSGAGNRWVAALTAALALGICSTSKSPFSWRAAVLSRLWFGR